MALSSTLIPGHFPSALAASRAEHAVHRHQMHGYAGTFPVLGFNGNSARGYATVSVSAAGTTIRAQINGLIPGTTHAIHIHAGFCALPYSGTHLYILGFVTANRFGAASIQGRALYPYIPGRQYLIVYEGPYPGRVIGCANLGALMRY
jgi:hypothetical protein